MKALRITLAVIGGALLLLVIVAIVAIRSFDLNNYTDEIAAYVEAHTGRTLTIGNNIEFTLFPWFAIETGAVTLSDDPAFGTRDFAEVESLAARIRVWPLLRRRIEIGTVILDGVSLNLGTDSDGRGNWASLLERPIPEAPGGATAAPERPSIAGLAVEGIVLRNVRLLWHDTAGDVIYVVRDLSLVTGSINDNEPVDINASLTLLDVASQAALELELEAVANLGPSPRLDDIQADFRALDSREQVRANGSAEIASVALDGERLRLGRVTADSDLVRPPLGPEEMTVTIEVGGAELDTGTEALSVTAIAAGSGGVSVDLSLSGENVLSTPRLRGAMNLEARTLREAIAALGMDLDPELAAQAASGLSLRSDFEFDLSAGTLSVGPFAISALGLEASGLAEVAVGDAVRASVELPAFGPSQELRALIGTGIPAGVELAAITSAEASANLDWSQTTGRLDLSDLRVRLDELDLGGRISLDDARSPGRVSGDITAVGLDNRLLGALFGPWLPPNLVEAPLGEFRLATSFEYERAAGVGALAPLELSAYGLAGEGELTVVNDSSGIGLSGRAALEEFSPRELLARFALPVPQSADPETLRSASLAASFETQGSNGEFRDIVIALDDSRITGELGVEDFADPRYRFVLRADRIDVDRYLPPRVEDQAPADAGERSVGEMRIATDPLTATVVDGTASIGHLRVGGMEFEQLTTVMAFGNGRAVLDSVSTELYGGRFLGSLTIDATEDVGQVHLAGNATSIRVEPLLLDMLGEAYLSGTGDVALDLRGRGSTINEALATAAGQMSLTLRNGVIEGINLGYELCKAVNASRGLTPPQNAPGVTAYSTMRATATVIGGNASFSELSASTDFVDLTAGGGLRLVDLWWDTRNRAQPKGNVAVAGCEELNRTLAADPIAFNFTLKGRFPDVDIGFDISQLLEDWIKREARQSIRDAATDRLRDLLN